MNPGAPELIIVLVIILLLFGAKRLPDLAGSVGKSIKEFRKASNEPDVEDSDATERDAPTA
ncbi:MAG: twin-arginine translocase TatA/TatE family subunit [Actinobacteria bacterium]|nr:twin-arginine translocase TatA/TatE family subunit [Actinomycetota bacterium]